MLINDLSDIKIKPADFEAVAEAVTFVYKLKYSTYCLLMLESSQQMTRASLYAEPSFYPNGGNGGRQAAAPKVS